MITCICTHWTLTACACILSSHWKQLLLCKLHLEITNASKRPLPNFHQIYCYWGLALTRSNLIRDAYQLLFSVWKCWWNVRQQLSDSWYRLLTFNTVIPSSLCTYCSNTCIFMCKQNVCLFHRVPKDLLEFEDCEVSKETRSVSFYLIHLLH